MAQFCGLLFVNWIATEKFPPAGVRSLAVMFSVRVEQVGVPSAWVVLLPLPWLVEAGVVAPETWADVLMLLPGDDADADRVGAVGGPTGEVVVAVP